MNSDQNNQQESRPECMRCKHYYVTWDPKFPYGCRAFGFKSKVAPYLEVYSASQTSCLKFEARELKRGGP